MLHPPTVIAVDDNQDELNQIVSALRGMDISCLPIHVNGTKPNITSKLTGVRLIFFDINYSPAKLSGTALYENAAEVLLNILDKDNGPYALITWSSTGEHSNLMNHFSEKIPTLPAPAVTAMLPKERFTVRADGSEATELRNEILNIVKERPQVDALLQWEMGTRKAAGDVIGSILSFAGRTALFNGTAGNELKSLLAHLAIAAAGKENVDLDRSGAINEALTPILYDRLMHRASTTSDKEIWDKAFEKIESTPSISPGQVAILNTLCHISFHIDAVKCGDRGAVFDLSGGNEKFVLAKTGLEPAHLYEQFVVTQKAKSSDIVPTDPKDWANCRWVLVGIRAICDQAQSRGHLRPVVLGLEVPAETQEKGTGFRVNRHGAILVTPVFSTSTSSTEVVERKIILNWHWVFGLGASELKDGKILYRLREALINQISSAQSSYSSRPGIIQFPAS